MKAEYVSIKIRKSTKKRLDVLQKIMGRTLVDMVDDAISAFQVNLMLDSKSFARALDEVEQK